MPWIYYLFIILHNRRNRNYSCCLLLVILAYKLVSWRSILLLLCTRAAMCLQKNCIYTSERVWLFFAFSFVLYLFDLANPSMSDKYVWYITHNVLMIAHTLTGPNCIGRRKFAISMENDLQIKPRYKSSCTPHRVCLCVCCAVHMQKMSITVSRLQRIVNEANERYCQQHESVISPFAQSASRLCNARMHLNPKSQHVVVILLPEQPPILRAFRILLLPARCRWWCRIRWFAVRIFTTFSATTHVRRVVGHIFANTWMNDE